MDFIIIIKNILYSYIPYKYLTLLLILLLYILIKDYKYFLPLNKISFYTKFLKICSNFKLLNNIEKINSTYPYLSLIIPVYNMEKYIERSLFSILNQSFKDFEIIIIKMMYSLIYYNIMLFLKVILNK